MAEGNTPPTSPSDSNSPSSTDSKMPSSMDTLLLRMQNERMYELRQIKHGERPVTGRGNRESLEEFMRRNVTTSSPQNGSSTADNGENGQGRRGGGVANKDECEAHRPESVVVEVQGLVRRQQVRSLLDSRFRDSLERIVRSSVVGAFEGRRKGRQSSLATRLNQEAGRAPIEATRRQTSTANDASSSETAAGGEVSVEFQGVQGLEDRGQGRPVQSHSIGAQAPVGQGQSHGGQNQSAGGQGQSHASRRTEADEVPVGAAAWRQQEEEERWMEQQRALWSQQTERTMEQRHRDDLVMEISELVHTQLVSNTLRSEFRDLMERRLGDQASGDPERARRSAAALRELPPSGIIRNDFSHLGIDRGHPNIGDLRTQRDMDDVSVVSATATIPFAQSNMAVTREMSALRAEMSEMKKLLKLSFELQKEVQRSVRQEVAAAMTGIRDTPPFPNNVRSQPSRSTRRDSQDAQCLVCLDKPADVVIYRCGHLCMCISCSLELKEREGHCPVCRAPIVDIMRVYKCS